MRLLAPVAVAAATLAFTAATSSSASAQMSKPVATAKPATSIVKAKKRPHCQPVVSKRTSRTVKG